MVRPVFIFAIGLVMAGSVAFGQGAIIPRPFPHPIPTPHPVPLKVKSIQFNTTIRGQVAETKVTQVFQNEYQWPVEGDFFFPLPDDATFSEFAIYDGDKRLKGEVLEKDKARGIYNSIVH